MPSSPQFYFSIAPIEFESPHHASRQIRDQPERAAAAVPRVASCDGHPPSPSGGRHGRCLVCRRDVRERIAWLEDG